MTTSTADRRSEALRDLAAAVALGSLHAVACLIVRRLGFTHVSDDDFARVTIAEAFAHAPRLDPSGTSWLPFPFWLLGGALAVVGRSLAAANAIGILTSSVAIILPYLALRSRGTSRIVSALALAFAVLSPWNLWLGAAPVPESFTTSFTAAAIIGLDRRGSSSVRRRGLELVFAVALLAACLSRYEPWPAAATLAIVLARRAVRDWRARASAKTSRRDLVTTALVLALAVSGPIAWMAWNAYAHGSPVHFFYRVSNYKRAIGEGSTDLLDALVFYPRLALSMRPDVTAAAACALLLLRSPKVFASWLTPLACTGAIVVFLAYGNARDGAPAHHPERALLSVVFVLALFAATTLAEAGALLFARARSSAAMLFALLVVGWLYQTGTAITHDLPGASEGEARTAQIARGLALRDAGVTHLVVTPCAFEHFALIAAYAKPENVEIRQKTGALVTRACPRVDAP